MGSTPQNDDEHIIAVLTSPSDSRSAASQAFIFIKKITIENATTETILRMITAPELRGHISFGFPGVSPNYLSRDWERQGAPYCDAATAQLKLIIKLTDQPYWSSVVETVRTSDLFFPMEVRPHIRTAPAASLAAKSRLQIGQPDIIGPSIAAERRPMRAMVVAAVDQESAHPGGAHLGEGDFLFADRHALLKRGPACK